MAAVSVGAIGSRDLPDHLTQLLVDIGSWITGAGMILNTGNADGSDAAFAAGGNNQPHLVHLHLPWASYNAGRIVASNVMHTRFSRDLEKLAADNHAAWGSLNDSSRKFLVRNASIVQSSGVVLYYQSGSKSWGGGTGHGIRIANALQKPTLRLTDNSSLQEVITFLLAS